MKINKYKDTSIKENRVDIYYNKLDSRIKLLFEFLEKSDSIEGIYNKKRKIILIDEIFYFEIVDRKCFAYLEKEVYQVAISLREVEEKYGTRGFARISKSVIVNIFKIDYLKTDLYMRVKAYLINGECQIINRSYKNLFYEKMLKLREERIQNEINY